MRKADCWTQNHFKKSFVHRIDTKIQEKITIKGKDVADVDDFTYLESKVYRERAGMKNLRNRLWQAKGAVMHKRKENQERQ